MARTKSMADKKPMSAVLARLQRARKSWACSKLKNCQDSHSSDSTTKGRPKRLTKLRTRPSMELVMSKVSTLPHIKVAA